MSVFTMDYLVSVHLLFHFPCDKFTIIVPPLILPKMKNKTLRAHTRGQPKLMSRSGTCHSSIVRTNPPHVSQLIDLEPWELVGQRLHRVRAQLTAIENNQLNMCWSYQICLVLQQYNMTRIENLLTMIANRFQIDLPPRDIEYKLTLPPRRAPTHRT